MKALNVKEPWISRRCDGRKTIETRTWNTHYRGELLLVGSKNPEGEHSGRAACVVELVDSRPMTQFDREAAQVEPYENAHSWVLENIRKVKPFPVKGQLSFYDVPDELVELEEDY